MNFISAQPSIVKAIKQRDLLNVWLRLYQRQQQLPGINAYQPDRFADEISELVHYTVDGTQSPPRFRIDTKGSRLANAYGATGGGRDLEEYLGPLRHPSVMPAYFTCVARALPVYTISMLIDTHGRTVAYERLLLPFSDSEVAAVDNPSTEQNPAAVTKIIASLKTISEDGRFEINNLFRNDEVLPAPTLSAVIDTGLQIRTISPTPENDVHIV